MSALPHVDASEALELALADPAPFARAAAALLSGYGLPPGPMAPARHGSFPVVLTDAHVLKFIPTRWRDKFDAEVMVLEHVAGRLPIPTPRLVVTGHAEGWHHMIMTRLPGERIGDVLPGASTHEQRGLLHQVGACLAALHALPIDGLEAITPAWPEFVGAQARTARARHERSGAEPAWLADVDAFLARLAPECARLSRVVLVTGDVTDDHVLVDRVDGRLAVTGLIDFGDALVGDAMYDFVSPSTFLVGGREDLLAALLDGYGTPTADRGEALRDRFMAYELLHRFAELGRDVARLPGAAPATLDGVARALWPTPG